MKYRTEFLWGLLIAACVALAFSGADRLGFVEYDDPAYVVDNPHVREGLSIAGLRWAFTSAHSANWHPLTWISHMLDVEIHGLDPAGHHRTSLLLHVANVLVVFLALRLATGRVTASAIVALGFGVHPLRVESVAWIAERKDLLSGLFGLLAILAYGWYAARPGWRRYATVLLLFVASLLSKPMLVTLPVVLLLLDLWPLERLGRGSGSAGALVAEKVPMFLLALASGVVTLGVQRAAGAAAGLEEIPWIDRLVQAATAPFVYLWKTLWPTGLAAFYPHPSLVADAGEWRSVALVLALVLAALSWIAWKRGAAHPRLAVSWTAYLVMLAPVLGIVQVGQQAVADRYTYLPLLAPLVALVFGLDEVLARRPRTAWVATSVAVGLLVLAISRTRSQVATWKDTRTLFEHALRVTENNYLAHSNVGVLDANEGRTDEAARHFEEAIRIRPGYAAAHNNLAKVRVSQGRLEDARQHLETAVRLRGDEPEYAYNLGNVLLRLGRTVEAVRKLEDAVRLRSDYGKAHHLLAVALASTGDDPGALRHLEVAVASEPGSAAAWGDLAKVLAKAERRQEAREACRRALVLRPDWPEMRVLRERLGGDRP